MRIETNFNVGENVLVLGKFGGVIDTITTRIYKNSIELNYKIEFDYRVDEIWYREEDLQSLDESKPKKTLYQALTEDLKSQAVIIKNLGIVAKTKEELENAEKILKGNLKIEVGETLIGDNIEIYMYNRTTTSYKGCKLYDDAMKKVEKAENFLKLSKMGISKTIQVIAMKKI